MRPLTLRENVWWVLAFLALAAALLLGPAGQLGGHALDLGKQGAGPTGYRDLRPVGPFAF